MWKCTGCNSINDEHDRFCGCCGRIRPEASRTIHLAATDTDRESTTLSKGIKEPVTQELENLKSYLHPGVGFLYVSAGLLIFGIIGASSAGNIVVFGNKAWHQQFLTPGLIHFFPDDFFYVC